ncbi:DUF6597 domain-containing transcriptional factor [Paenibacillus sp. SAFN-117]|uniref:DUF6597 domain-containing transcriptional factor n=1 Tax=Paenibacillus sp. SAFN-117 TaxID=3436860 RepID=UPI003F7E8F67
MNSNQSSIPDTGRPSLGVLNFREGTKRFFELTRYPPSEDIGYFVKHFWMVRWDLNGQPPYLQQVVPNPCVNMVVEKNRTLIYGAAKHKFSRLLEGKDMVFGVKFKPGGFYPFAKRPISRLTGRFIRLESIFNVETESFEEQILSQDSPEKMVELAEALIRRNLPGRDEKVVRINQIIDRIQADRGITKVDQVCDGFQINIRKLQRMFGQYVGVSPKWVIKLYRLQNAAETLDKGRAPDWLDLSLKLGYYDQSHFIRDFRSIIGKTPEEFLTESKETMEH